MNCFEVASRLRLLNTLASYLPGSGGNDLFADDMAFKSAFYRLMLPQWQLNFDAAGHQLDDPLYTMKRLASFMEQQRLHHDAQKDLERRGQRQPARNGRSFRRQTPYNRQYQQSGRSHGNSYGRSNTFSSPFPRPHRFGNNPVRSFRPQSTTRQTYPPRTPSNSGTNQGSRQITGSNRPNTRSQTRTHSGGRGVNRQLALYQDRSRFQRRRHGNYYIDNDNYYQDEPDNGLDQDQQNEDGFFNQDLDQDQPYDHQHDDGFFNQTYDQDDDNFYNQDDAFFNQNPCDDFDHHDEQIESHDVYEQQASA
jgi:hypothetical protein